MQTKITTENLNKWQVETEVLYAWDKEAQKQLYCVLAGWYRVLHKGVLVMVTTHIDKAVEKYNSIETETPNQE